MDEKDMIIKELLTSFEESKVPFGFENRVMDKIRKEALERESRRETIRNIAIALLVGIMFLAALFVMNTLFFQSSQIVNFMYSLGNLLEILKSGEALIWILVGANLTILVICERLISKKMKLE
ncbi:MAG: hypothetical protein AB7S40_10140 [Bacteroidales bacterium]